LKIGINTLAEKQVYGITGWRVWIKQAGKVSSTQELLETQSLDEAISVIETKIDSLK